MDTSVVMLVNVVLWSFGISAALLVGVMAIDWLASRRVVRERSGVEVQSRFENVQAPLARVQLPSAQRRRASAIQPAAKAA